MQALGKQEAVLRSSPALYGSAARAFMDPEGDSNSKSPSMNGVPNFQVDRKNIRYLFAGLLDTGISRFWIT